MDALNNTLDNFQKLQIETIFMKYYKEWCMLSFSYVENMSEAEDMVQDVFVKVLHRNSTTDILNLKSYISTAIRNTCLKRIQRMRKNERIEEGDLQDFVLSHEEFLIGEEQKNKVKQSIEVLPEQSKRVFELCVLEGAKYQNAADTLGISINTVKFHLKKSFRLLRGTLRKTYF